MKIELLSEKPETQTHSTPILFVHGAWHGAWCWQEYFMPYFSQKGWDTYALSLRGHGNSEGGIRWASAANYVEDVAGVVEQIGKPTIVVGHSMGGYVVQKYLETHHAPAAVLLASIPSSGILGFTLRTARRHPIALLKMMLTLDPYYLINTPELAQEAFFSADLPRERIEKYFPHLHTESQRATLDALFLNLPHPNRVKTPLLVLAAANDRVFPVSEEQNTARAYNTQAEVFPDMAHDMMLEAGWQGVADRCIAWLSERGL